MNYSGQGIIEIHIFLFHSLHFIPLTSEVKLLDWLSAGGLFVLVVGDGGVLEHKPVVFVRPQCKSFGP